MSKMGLNRINIEGPVSKRCDRAYRPGRYPKLANRGEVELAFCWVHMRRNFYELAAAGPAPIASEALKHIAAIYAIEKDIRGRSPEERRLVRQQKSRPLVDAFEAWLRAKLALISQKIKLAEAIRYALSRWQGLTRFIDDGRIELDNNTVERSIRGIKLSRKNARLPDPTAVSNTGRRRLPSRVRQAQRRRSARLSHRHPDPDRQRASKPRHRPATALGLPASALKAVH
jgi:hypothetical protein